MNKKTKISVILGSLILPVVVFAQTPTVKGIIDGAVQIAWYVADGIIVILWIVTGILFLTALGDPSKTKLAKGALFAAIVGTLVIIVAGSAVYLVGNAFNISTTG